MKDYDFQKIKFNEFYFKRLFLSYLIQNKIKEAGNLLKSASSDKKNIADNFEEFKIKFNEAGSLKNMDLKKFDDILLYSKENRDSIKNVKLSLLLGIIPGCGYVYSGNTATGVVAFLVVSVFSALTYFSFKTDNKPVGIFLGAAATFFYAGSVMGGYLSTHRSKEILDANYTL